MLNQGLSVKLGQGLTMTPQLQQAIRLLQLSSIELQQEVQEQIETNPLLERVDDALNETNNNDADIVHHDNDPAEHEYQENNTIPDALPMDTHWDEIYDGDWKTGNNHSETNASELIDIIHSPEKTLRDHLQEQITLSHLSVIDKKIATTIISYINPKGFLTESIQQIFQALQHHLPIEEDEIDVILRYIQNLDPIGIGARDLSEALQLQLKHHYDDHFLHMKAQKLLQKHLDLIQKRDYKSIKKLLKLTSNEFKQIMGLIQSLNPNSCDRFDTSTITYITPDVYVQKIKDKWVTSLNKETLPELQINNYYSNMLTHLSNKKDRHYLKNNMQQARWFMKSIENRNNTVLNVANAIVERQVAFFQYGEEAMKPMILKDLAEQLELHESTISRVTTQKYMHTPRGVIEFKYFFSSHIRTSTGGACSSTAIQAMIKKLITSEPTKKPLSDSKLTALLKKQGINVARRTVAKYREAMNIPSSHERKTFA